MRMFRKYNMIENQAEWRYYHMFKPMVDMPVQASLQKNMSEDVTPLVKKALERYPDLRFESFNKMRPGMALVNRNYLMDFVEYQQGLIGKGYTEEKAFQITEQKF